MSLYDDERAQRCCDMPCKDWVFVIAVFVAMLAGIAGLVWAVWKLA